MDAKEIKACLKAAREAIRIKDFKTAAKQCKAILDRDGDNYNALVFLGVAAEGLDDTEEALKAYRKAVVQVPDQPLAWQGYGSLLEKHSSIVETKEVIEVFEKLLTFSQVDEAKQISILHKLADAYVKANVHKEAYSTVLKLLKMETESAGRVISCRLLVDILNSDGFQMEKSHEEQYKTCLNELLDDHSALNQEEQSKYITLYLLHTTTKEDINIFPAKCDEMRKRFPEAEASLELSIRLELEKSIGENTVPDSTVNLVDDLLQSLKKVNPHNWIIAVTDGFLEFQRKKYLQAKKSFSEIDSTSPCVFYYLAKSSCAVHNYSLCLETCEKGMTSCADSKVILLVPSETISDSFKLLEAEALRHQGFPQDLAKAITVLEELKGQRPEEVSFLLTCCYLDQGKNQEAEMCLKQLPQEHIQAKTLKALIHMQREEYSQAVEHLKAVIALDAENPLATLKLGVTLWKLRDSNEMENVKQLCFNTLLKAAKLDPYNYESFLYLGRFYHVIQKDLNKAKRCFQKAYDLNPGKDDAGCALVDILVEINEMEQAIVILKGVTSKAPAGRRKWAWLRLGLHQIKFEDPTFAIASLQSALRADPNDHHIWECLAEAYLHRGSLTAALKAFTKASELKPDSIYCQYQMASVRQTLGLLPQAIEEYKQILDKEHSYVPALKGLGESLVLLGRQHLCQCLDGLAQDCLEEALVYLSRGASQRPEFSCLWKLMGDACNTVSKLASNSYLVPGKMLSKGTTSTETCQVTKMQILEIGSRCYSAAIKIIPEKGSLWHDLGVSLFNQCTDNVRKSNNSDEDLSVVCRGLLERAKKAMQKALTLEPSDWRHWNSLGVMACCKVNYKPAFAQHCYIKSIECEANNVLAWSNLGSLYLSEDQIQMAHNAFQAAQRLDPTYVVGWIGQAMIAEIVGHVEAMDLFRHTTDLSAHPESQLGYGKFVLEALRDKTKLSTDLFNYCIHQMAAIPAATDALVRYTVRCKTDPIAYNMLGLLFEHQNLLGSSIAAFTNSLNLLAVTDPRNVKIDVQMNLARVLCKDGQYEESSKEFHLIADHLDFHHLCFYGLAEYQCSNFLQSVKVYQFAADRLSDNDAAERSQLYTAMGMVAFKAGDDKEAKSQLFNGFQTETPSFHGLVALCALGLLEEDMTLANAVLNEFNKRPDCERLSLQTVILRLYVHVLKGSNTGGECMLRDMLEDTQVTVTDAPAVWNLLANYLVLTFSHLGISAAECARSYTPSNQPKSLESLIIETVAQLQAGQHNTFRNEDNAFKTAQRAFHQNPGDTRAMCVLASASHAEGVLRKAATNDVSMFVLEKALLAVVMENEKKDDQMMAWCLKQLTLCSVELENKSEAMQYLNQLKKHFPETNAFVCALELHLSSSVPANMSISSMKDLDLLSLAVSVSLLGNADQYDLLVDFLKYLMADENAECQSLTRTSLLELLSHLMFKKVQAQVETADMKAAFEDSITFAKEKEVGSPILSLMHGIHSISSNKRLAKHLFATTLDQCQARNGNGWCKSFARQGLMILLCDSSKESDVQLLQALLQDATRDGDKTTKALYKEMTK